ncbi:MAG: hypothetical protein VW236_08240 [Flavobacteriaceae bacterium]
MFLKNYKFNSFKKKLEHIISKEIYNPIVVSRRISENYINHCWADKLNPEESVLYIIGKHLETSQNYDSARDFRISSGPNRTVSIKEWHVYAEKWRDEGKVSRHIFNEFNEAFSYVKDRWPQLYNGDEPEVRALWHLYFNASNETEPHKVFKEYQEAIDYILAHSETDLWWHSYGLESLYYEKESTIKYFEKEKIPREKDGRQMYSDVIKIPNWKKNDPPPETLITGEEKRDPSDEFGRYICDHQLFAITEQKFDEWAQQVHTRRDNPYGVVEPDMDLLLQDSWWLDYKIFDVPIDNHDPDSVPYNMLVKKVS